MSAYEVPDTTTAVGREVEENKEEGPSGQRRRTHERREGAGQVGREEGRERERGTDGEKQHKDKDGGQPLLLPCRLSLTAQGKTVFFHLKIVLAKTFSTGLGGAIVSARSATQLEMLTVNCDNSTHRAPERGARRTESEERRRE